MLEIATAEIRPDIRKRNHQSPQMILRGMREVRKRSRTLQCPLLIYFIKVELLDPNSFRKLKIQDDERFERPRCGRTETVYVTENRIELVRKNI